MGLSFRAAIGVLVVLYAFITQKNFVSLLLHTTTAGQIWMKIIKYGKKTESIK